MICHSIRHCVYEVTELERLRVKNAAIQLALRLQKTSDEAISLHQLTEKSFCNDYKTTLLESRARRLLRGCSTDEPSSCLAHARLNLAMTNVKVMV